MKHRLAARSIFALLLAIDGCTSGGRTVNASSRTGRVGRGLVMTSDDGGGHLWHGHRFGAA